VNWVDVLVLVLALLDRASGARQGTVTAAASFIGVLAGAVIGVRIAPSLIAGYQSPEVRVALGVSIVIVLVALGETLGVLLGRAVQRRIDIEGVAPGGQLPVVPWCRASRLWVWPGSFPWH